jgi:predicted  nucleic acid-binding Zn-ribbon protein
MSRPFKLYRLQQLDSQLDQASLRLGEIEKILADDEDLRKARIHTDATAAALDSARKLLKRDEENVSAQRIKIEQTEATLYGGKVRNPKELQDLQNEAAALKRYLSVLEDRQLDSMISLEQAQANHQAAVELLEKAESKSASRYKELSAEQSILTGEVDNLQVERQAASASILEDDLKLYNQLRQQRRGVAVAKVVDKACGACGSTLNAALLHAARSPNQITRCDSCGRILYTG